MSIPSLMTPTAPHNSRYAHHATHPAYNESHLGGGYSSQTITHGSSRMPPSYNFHKNSTPHTTRPPAQLSRQLPVPLNMPQSHSKSTLKESKKRDRGHPNWDEFYKNGPPKEIIVIDDDDDEEEEGTLPSKKSHPSSSVALQGGTDSGLSHANKKRRTGQTSAYDAARDNYATSQSHGRNYSHRNSASNTNSADRGASLGYNTTAPTSLSSTGSAGAAYVDDAVVGQKRKRTTRKSLADERKLKDIDILGDPNSQYVPPPHPPIKAKDVHVPQIRDVRICIDLIRGDPY